MPVFKFKAANNSGKTKKGIIDAASREQAIRKLRKDGLFPLDVEAVGRQHKKAGGLSIAKLAGRLFRRVSPESLAASIRQLALLLQASLPLDQALGAIIHGEGKQDEMQRIMSEVRESIREGKDLAGSFANYPHVFSTTFVTMVRAGENSGSLDIVMEQLAEHIEQKLAFRRKIQATLAYPLLMLVVGVCVVVFLLTFVVPKVTQIFYDLERTLPLPTRILLFISDLLQRHWALLVGLMLVGGYLLYRYVRTVPGRARLDRFLLKVPQVGAVIRLTSVGRFARTLGMLLKNGAPLVSSLEIVENVAGNTVMRQVVQQIRQNVQEGKSLTRPMESSGIFQHAAVRLIAAGEESGHLDEMLLFVSKDCEHKVSSRLQILTSLMEPAMILILGCLVGFVVMAIMLPVFEMSSLIE